MQYGEFAKVYDAFSKKVLLFSAVFFTGAVIAFFINDKKGVTTLD